jgi:hypothetical protein
MGSNRRKRGDRPFPIVDARKRLAGIDAQAGTKVQGHDERATFGSIAEEIVFGGVLKRMRESRCRLPGLLAPAPPAIMRSQRQR